MTTKTMPPPITPLEFDEDDFGKAERLAAALGYEQTAYTSTSDLWGLFCVRDGAADRKRPGCIIKTAQFGLMFVQDVEDITGEVEI